MLQPLPTVYCFVSPGVYRALVLCLGNFWVDLFLQLLVVKIFGGVEVCETRTGANTAAG